MGRDPPRPKVPTPVELATLKRLLAEHDAFEAFLKDSPTAHQEREQRAAEERRLRDEQDRLAREERAASRHLVDLQLALDDVTEEMMAAAIRNSQGDLRRIERAQKWLAAIKVNPDLKKVSAEDYAEALRVCFWSVFPELFSVEQSPTVAEMEFCAQREAC